MPYAKEGFTDAATGIVFSEQRYHLPANDSELTGATAGALHPEALGREPEQGSVGNEWQGGSTASEAKHRASKDLAAEYKACERPLPVVCWDLRGPLRASVTATYCIGRYSVVKQVRLPVKCSPLFTYPANVPAIANHAGWTLSHAQVPIQCTWTATWHLHLCSA